MSNHSYTGYRCDNSLAPRFEPTLDEEMIVAMRLIRALEILPARFYVSTCRSMRRVRENDLAVNA